MNKIWSLRGVEGTGLNVPMPEEEARELQRIYEYKTAYLVSSVDKGETWQREVAYNQPAGSVTNG